MRALALHTGGCKYRSGVVENVDPWKVNPPPSFVFFFFFVSFVKNPCPCDFLAYIKF